MRKSCSFLLSILLVLSVLALPRATARGDEITVKKAGKFVGVIARREDGKVYVNTFNSRNPRMTRGVEIFDEARLAGVKEDDDPHRRYLRRRWAIRQGTDETSADEEHELGQLAEAAKQKSVAVGHWLRALEKNANHAGALSRLPERTARERRRSDWRFNAALLAEIRAALDLDDAKARKAELAEWKSEYGFDRPMHWLERVRRSRSQPKGTREDVRLTYDSRETAGLFTIHVPEAYDPMRPWPLVVGLHGGGPDGKDRTGVVGSGRSAMNFYRSGADRLGYIVVCPNALRAPWRQDVNEALILGLLEETTLLYNIDLNRVYLTGHSLGGYGTWAWGPEHAHLWAAIAPMSGGGHNGLERLAASRTGVYLYHGADDDVVGVGDSRRAADRMRDMRHDFIYTELPDSGHGFPGDVNDEMWEFFETHRLAVTPKRDGKGTFKPTLEEYSSFLRRVSKEEKLYLGAPGTPLPKDKKSLLARVKLGGGAAERAAKALVELADPTTVASLGKLVANARLRGDVRIMAARALGGLALAKGLAPLTKGLRTDDLEVVAEVGVALASFHDKKAAKSINRAAKRVDKAFEERLSGKDRMAFSDWKLCMNAFEGLCRAAGGTRDAVAVPALETISARLAGSWTVAQGRRARSDPDIPLARAVVACIEACGGIGGARAVAVVDALVTRHRGLEGVEEAAREAR